MALSAARTARAALARMCAPPGPAAAAAASGPWAGTAWAAAPAECAAAAACTPVLAAHRVQAWQPHGSRAFSTASPSSPTASTSSTASASNGPGNTNGSGGSSGAASSGAGGAKGHSSASAGGEALHVTVEPLDSPYEGVSVLTLQRSAVRNAIGRQMLGELAQVLDVLRQETTRCVVLRSTVPGVFSAGADLKERATMTLRETREFVGLLRRTFNAVEALPMPTIAAIEGVALGGGAELALAADLRVAGKGAVFALPECRLGIIPGAGGTQRLPRLVGPSKAKELMFTGSKVGAAVALQIGLVDHVVDEGQAYAKALELAQEVAKAAPLSLRMAKQAVNNGMQVDIGTGLQLEEAYYAQCLTSRDRREGLDAFAQKRPPVYTGE